MTSGGFVPPPYPYDRLDELRAIAGGLPGGGVDMSIGAPCDAPPSTVIEALADSASERGYPPSIGSGEFREAASGWLQRRFSIALDPGQLAACVGTKEFVAGLPAWLALRTPGRDTVLYPAVSYPTYAMGATLAGCRAVPVEMDEQWRINVESISDKDAARALCLWVNSPGNPAGGLDDLEAVAGWGRSHEVPVFSDECYIEFTWADPHPRSRPHDQPGRSILEWGSERVVALHSLSKRSSLAGVRAGFYGGDPDLVHYLSELRKHSGMMVPGPVQAAASVAFADDAHVDLQRAVYRSRLESMVEVLGQLGCHATMPDGGFYLWVGAPNGDAWELARRLATDIGVVGSPGEFYGPAAAGFLRLAMVQPDDRIALLAERAGA
jgi:aspartate/methionine/tyrosine aminotransferase